MLNGRLMPDAVRGGWHVPGPFSLTERVAEIKPESMKNRGKG